MQYISKASPNLDDLLTGSRKSLLTNWSTVDQRPTTSIFGSWSFMQSWSSNRPQKWSKHSLLNNELQLQRITNTSKLIIKPTKIIGVYQASKVDQLCIGNTPDLRQKHTHTHAASTSITDPETMATYGWNDPLVQSLTLVTVGHSTSIGQAPPVPEFQHVTAQRRSPACHC